MATATEEKVFEKKFLRVFGGRIGAARKGMGLTQAEFAKKVNVAPSYLASIETGRRWPHLTIIYSIAEALGKEPCQLLEGIEEEIGWH